MKERERQYFAEMWREKDKKKKKKKAAKDRHYAFTVSNNFCSCLGKYLILCRSRALGRVDQKNLKRTRAKHCKNSFGDKMTLYQM